MEEAILFLFQTTYTVYQTKLRKFCRRCIRGSSSRGTKYDKIILWNRGSEYISKRSGKITQQSKYFLLKRKKKWLICPRHLKDM